jgi:hypothetical protein
MTTTLTPTESEDQFLHSNTHKDYVFIALFGLRWTDRPHHEEEEVTVPIKFDFLCEVLVRSGNCLRSQQKICLRAGLAGVDTISLKY